MLPRHCFVLAVSTLALLAPVSPVSATTRDALPEVRVTSPSGAETSAVAISPVNPQVLVASANVPDSVTCLHYSHDGGATWTPVAMPQHTDVCFGPTVGWSSGGQYAYTATIDGCGEGCRIFFYRSDDGGMTWNSLESEPGGEPRRLVATGAGSAYLHVDRSATSPHLENVYAAYAKFGVVYFARSRNQGHKWSEQSISGAPNGSGGDVTTDRDGDVYYAWPGTGTTAVYVTKSTNGGSSFGDVVTVASRNTFGGFGIPALPYGGVPNRLFADTDTTDGPYAGSVYLIWPDSTGPESPVATENHGRIQVAYSRDGGETWAVTTPHETADHLTVDRWQANIAVGDNGVVHVVFNDTRRSGDRLSVDVFYSYSIDGAQTWSAPRRVSGAMSPAIEHWREFGGYSGLDIVADDLVATYTDNRQEEGGTGDSVDIYAAGITPGGSSTGAGRIPGARGVAGTPLTITRLGTGELRLDGEPACGPGDDYAVYEWTIGLFDEKRLVRCTAGGETFTTLAPSQAACHPQIIGACP